MPDSMEWRVHALAALNATRRGDLLEATTRLLAMLNDGPSTATVSASLLWVSILIREANPPAGLFVPDSAPGFSDAQMWAFRVIAARINDKPVTGQELFLEATSGDGSYLLERLVALVTLVAAKLNEVGA